MLKTLIQPLLTFSLLNLLSISCFAQAPITSEELQRIKRSVVKIYTTISAPDYFTPWRQLNPRQSNGSGAIIDGRNILTNAHVVANASYIQVQKEGDPAKYEAEVRFVSHEADLALLHVKDPRFYDQTLALTIGNMPPPLAGVSVFGYPMGGKSLSITQGIISRIEHQRYAHNGSKLLAGQIDAAINPGNSGGPVIVNGTIVGVAMQANVSGNAENLGYFIPPSIIRHFLIDAQDGSIHGIPQLGIESQSLENPAMRKAYGLTTEQSGIMITQLKSGGSAKRSLKAGDIILRIGQYNIANDQTIEFQPGLRTHYKYAIDQYHNGDDIPISYVRNGNVRQLKLTARKPKHSYSLVQEEQFDQLPRYLIHGGVVFVPLNMNLIKRWGSDWRNQAPVDYLAARSQWRTSQRQEAVVAIKILPSEVNLGYHDWHNWIIHEINGTTIANFDQFADIIANLNEDIVIKDQDGYTMVLDQQLAQITESEILTIYRVPAPHSKGLFEP